MRPSRAASLGDGEEGVGWVGGYALVGGGEGAAVLCLWMEGRVGQQLPGEEVCMNAFQRRGGGQHIPLTGVPGGDWWR